MNLKDIIIVTVFVIIFIVVTQIVIIQNQENLRNCTENCTTLWAVPINSTVITLNDLKSYSSGKGSVLTRTSEQVKSTP